MSYSCISHGDTYCDGCIEPGHKQVNGGLFQTEHPKEHKEHNKKLGPPFKLAHWKRGRKKETR